MPLSGEHGDTGEVVGEPEPRVQVAPQCEPHLGI